MWTLSLVTPPALDPLDIIEAEEHCRLDPDLAPQDVLLQGAMKAAALNCETFTRRQLITATWELWMDSWHEEGVYRDGALLVPRPPLASVTNVRYIDTAGVEQVWPAGATGYLTQIPAGPQAPRGRIYPAYGVPWPTIRCQPGAVKVLFLAGYGLEPALVPAGLRNGMLLEVAEMYERRELLTIGTISTPNMITAERLWWPYRATF